MLGAESISVREGRICLNFLLLVVVLFYVSLVFLYTQVYLSTDEGMKKRKRWKMDATNAVEDIVVDRLPERVIQDMVQLEKLEA